MKVHIVHRQANRGSPLNNMVQWLVAGTGWSFSDMPDATADLNYFMTYIDFAERFTDWHRTPVAVHFSHYEEGTPYKEFFWKVAREKADFFVIMAEQYAALLPGKPIVRVCPPLDSQRFVVQGKKNRERERVGVAGFVDRSGRKGPELVARLAGSKLGRDLDLVATGNGWPIPTKYKKFSELPAYYNSLDVFLCTSKIEGYPLPPLEALACGIPVVIPMGVGMLDELPDIPGIYHYQVGEYSMMEAALRMALDEKADRGVLRDAVSEYSLANWCRDHERGFAAVLENGVTMFEREKDRWGRRGVYYVAFGEPARQCAKAAMESFKHHMPDIPIALASDRPIGGEDIFIQQPDADIGGRMAKLQIYDLTPPEWAYILYLDADTEVVAPVYFLYELLEDGWDMVICKNPGKYHTVRKMVRSDNEDECEVTFDQIGSDNLLQLNGGVFAFQRNQQTAAFYRGWYEEWQKWGKRDQAALLRTLFKNPLKLYVLGNEWNTITRYDPKEISAGILHYPMTARRWRGLIPGRLDGKEAWKRVERWEKEQRHP